MSRQIGKQAEITAEHWLASKGVTVVTRNYHCRQGEIDIIGLDNQTLCFIEVKYRENDHFGSAAQSVTISKQRKIIHTAQIYLAQHNEYQEHACRFDVLTIMGNLEQPQIDWHKNAFIISV